MTTTFWFNDPSVLLNKQKIFKLWPHSSMKQEEKLNTITKLVILLTSLGYFLTNSNNILFSGIFTIVAIVIFYKTTTKSNMPELIEKLDKEGFTGVETFEELKENFDEPTSKNPLQNMEPVKDNTEKKPAAPSFNPIIDDKINEVAKKQIEEIHSDFPDMNKKLFRDLGEHENFQNSMRPFYSMPNTRLPNDQKSFTDYCYGDMHSKKEDVDILNEDRF